jgi:acetyl esterase/lipase
MNEIYKGMDRATLDAAYNNRVAVRDSTEVSDWYIAESEITYRTLPCSRDLRYGDRPAQRYDLFAVKDSRKPFVVFIHGGYWQTRAKEHYACVADGLVKSGFPVVLAEYTLAPEAGMTEIADEIGTLLDHLGSTLRSPDGASPRLILSGHSAGGHLAACFRDHPMVHGVLGISGVYELEPIRLSYLNEALQLSEVEVGRLSPQRRVGAGAPTIVAVGGAEMPEFAVQSREYAEALAGAEQHVHLVTVPRKNHFTVLDELRSADGILLGLIELLARAAGDTGST